MDEETNDTRGSNSSSKTKREPSNNQDVLNVEDVKLGQEDAPGSSLSEESIMVVGSNSDCDKSNASMKRSNKTPALLISKLPKHFSFQQVKEYLEKLCGPCEISDLKDRDDGKAVKAILRNMEQMTAAKRILTSEAIDGANIYVTDADEDMEQDEGPPVKRKKEEEDEGPWGLDMDVWRTDPKGLYGVKPEYLTTLGVNDTLRNWVLVLNFRCGKEELREVMELAGTVLVCSVHNRRSSHNANVMYSHPLEALQSISMLNGQMLYGRPLTVKMLKSNGAVLPKGLNNIGPGLAKYGKPLRDIVRHYKRFVKGQACGLNVNLFRTPEEQADQEAENITEGEDSKKRAKMAMENLVSEGIDIKDLVFALKQIIAEHKEEENEHLISELNDSDNDSARETGSNSTNKNMVVIRCNSNDGNNSPAASPDPEKRPNSKKTVQLANLVSLPPSSDSGSISVFPGSNSLSARSTPSPSAPKRPGNPMRPIGTPSSSSSSYSSRYMAPIPPPIPGIISNPCSQIFPPNAPRTPIPIRPMSSPMFGQSGIMPGPSRLGPMPGPITSPMSRPMSGPMGGPMSAPMSGQMSGHMSGPMSGPNGPMSGPGRLMSGLQPPGTTSFAMPGPNTHPPFGPTVQPTSGPGATLQFSNLPPSTTFALLSDKLAQVGQLVSIQFTVPGCVVAKYAHRSHAELCIKQFDKTCLDGNIIDVRFI